MDVHIHNDYNEIKALTMHKMVEEIDVDASSQPRKLLFLTDAQANVMANTEGSMDKLMTAFEFRQPKLVIQFLRSIGSIRWYGSLQGDVLTSSAAVRGGVKKHFPPWESRRAAYQAEERLVTFMREVLIPLAADTNAVIIGCANAGDCTLSTAFGQALALESAKWRGGPPFTFIGTSSEMVQFYLNECEKLEQGLPPPFWSKIASKSKSWMARDTRLRKIIVDQRDLPAYKGTNRLDLDPNVLNYIIVDTVDDTNNCIDSTKAAHGQLVTELFRYLIETLPSISIKTGMSEQSGPISMDMALMSLKAGSPVLFLDMRERQPLLTAQPPDTSNKDRAQRTKEHMEGRMREAQGHYEEEVAQWACHSPPLAEVFDVMSVSYFWQALFPVRRTTEGPQSAQKQLFEAIEDAVSGASGNSSGQSRSDLRAEVEALVDFYTRILWDDMWRLHPDNPNNNPSRRSASVATDPGRSGSTARVTPAPRVPSTRLSPNLPGSVPETSAGEGGEGVGGDDREEAAAAALPWRGHARDVESGPRTAEAVAVEHEGNDADPLAEERLTVPDLAMDQGTRGERPVGERAGDVPVHGAAQEVARRAVEEEEEEKGAHAKWMMEHGYQMSTKYKSVVVAMMLDENFHGLNIRDLENARHKVRELVMLDRLPKHEALQGLLLLRQAWSEYDVAMDLAGWYKRVTKSSYLLLLLLGIATVTATSLDGYECGVVDEADSELAGLSPEALARVCSPTIDVGILNNAILALSLASTLFISLLSFSNPSQRWRHLRTSACALQSIILQYRTRVGPFTQSRMDSKQPQNRLLQHLTEWRGHLVSGTDLQVTNLEKQHPPHVYKHGQYEPQGRRKRAGACWSIWRVCCWWGRQEAMVSDIADLTDDFFSPMQPEDYIRFRIEPTRAFYQHRIPRASRVRLCLQVLVIASSALNSAMAALNVTSWVAVVSSVAAALTSWVEFTDLGKKLERYSSSVRELKNLGAWWGSLSEVEKASMDSISFLVMRGEEIITSETQTWQSTNAAKDDQRLRDKNKDEASGDNKTK